MSHLAVLIEYQRVTDRQTDERTDGHLAMIVRYCAVKMQDKSSAKHDVLAPVALSTFAITKYKRIAGCCRLANAALYIRADHTIFITFLAQQCGF